MGNRERLAEAAMQVSESLAAEVLDFLEFTKQREDQRKQAAFAEWQRTCPEEGEPVSSDVAARLEVAEQEESVPSAEVYRQAGLQ